MILSAPWTVSTVADQSCALRSPCDNRHALAAQARPLFATTPYARSGQDVIFETGSMVLMDVPETDTPLARGG